MVNARRIQSLKNDKRIRYLSSSIVVIVLEGLKHSRTIRKRKRKGHCNWIAYIGLRYSSLMCQEVSRSEKCWAIWRNPFSCVSWPLLSSLVVAPHVGSRIHCVHACIIYCFINLFRCNIDICLSMPPWRMCCSNKKLLMTQQVYHPPPDKNKIHTTSLMAKQSSVTAWF